MSDNPSIKFSSARHKDFKKWIFVPLLSSDKDPLLLKILIQQVYPFEQHVLTITAIIFRLTTYADTISRYKPIDLLPWIGQLYSTLTERGTCDHSIDGFPKRSVTIPVLSIPAQTSFRLFATINKRLHGASDAAAGLHRDTLVHGGKATK